MWNLPHIDTTLLYVIIKKSNVNFPQYLYIYTNKHPVVLSQRVFFMIYSMLVLFY